MLNFRSVIFIIVVSLVAYQAYLRHDPKLSDAIRNGNKPLRTAVTNNPQLRPQEPTVQPEGSNRFGFDQ